MDLSEKKLEEIITKSLEPFAKAIQDDLGGVNKRLDSVETRLTSVETRLTSVETRLTSVDARLDSVETRLISVETRLTSVEDDVGWMKKNANALFTKIDKFITMYEEQRQELTMLSGQVRRLEDRVVALERR